MIFYQFSLLRMFLFLLASFGTLSCLTTALPSGFVEEEIVRVDAITGAFAPNPRKGGKPMLLLSGKEGKINVMEDPDNREDFFEIADFSSIICTNGERGVQTIRPHPDFERNRNIYVYYTRIEDGCLEDEDKGPKNRLSRFTMDAKTLKLTMSSEKMIFQTSPLAKRVHNGGAIEFGRDGKIWISTGEGSATSTDLDWSQQLHVMHGKILRINQDGSVPDDNPFVGDNNAVKCNMRGGRTSKDKICSEIWAYGQRNPFRMVMDPRTKDDEVIFYVGDVGASVWEEISIGGTQYPGVNYGWNKREGPCKRNRNNQCEVQDQYMDPFYYYEHRKAIEGGAVVGSTFVPEDVWPRKYEFMFSDFVFKEIYNLIEDKDQECRSCTPPIPGYRNETFYHLTENQNIIDIFFGPYKNTQALYIVSRGPGITLRRIHYTKGEDNRSPTAKIQIKDADDTVFSVGQEIQLDGRQSSDPDDDSLTYVWDFGDGSTVEGVERPKHSYKKKGQYRITLKVEDEGGLQDFDFVTVTIGVPPTVQMLSPEEGELFSVEQELRLSGRGIDSTGKDAALSWEVRQHHADHFHPFLDPGTERNNFDLFPAPEPEDLLAATNSYLEIILTAVDKNGLSSTISRKVMPRVVMINVDSDPQGMKLMIDESTVVTPATITSWDNHNLLFDIQDQFPYTFDSWRNGASRRHQSRISLINRYFSAIFKTKSDGELQTIRLVGEVRPCSESDPCGQCEGHCNKSNECQDGLVCFQKGGRGKPVPGCIGIDNSRTDWCTYQFFIDGGNDSDPSPVTTRPPTTSPVTTRPPTTSPVTTRPPTSPPTFIPIRPPTRPPTFILTRLPTPDPSPAPLSVDICICLEEWSSPADGKGCLDQSGCQACDNKDDIGWCLIANPGCPTEIIEKDGTHWSYCKM